jgi:hypothetical protein
MTRDEDALMVAQSVTMDGNAFRAMVAVLQAASGDMLHRHVMVVQAAIETARAGASQSEPVETVQAG